MTRKQLVFIGLVLFLIVISSFAYIAYAWTSIPVVDDPLVRMPGTQQGAVDLPGSGQCLNCHADYDQDVEPGYNWKGSMMAQAARDFLFWPTVAVAAQDAIWAVGNPNATDMCLRCHFPTGWLAGRSDPTNATAMTGTDYDGVQCTLCHAMYDPFYQDTYDGVREEMIGRDIGMKPLPNRNLRPKQHYRKIRIWQPPSPCSMAILSL